LKRGQKAQGGVGALYNGRTASFSQACPAEFFTRHRAFHYARAPL